MIKLKDLKELCDKYCLQKQEGLGVLKKCTLCSNCKRRGVVEYNGGELYECVFCGSVE